MTNIFNRILKSRKRPILIYKHLLFLIAPILPDKFYLKQLFPIYTGYKLNLKNPQTYNEKLQWLKLYYRNPLYPALVDKYEYKEYIKEIVGEQYVVENYGVWNAFEEIDFDKLPNQFVLKTTHDQGGVVICKDKKTFDFNEAKKKLNSHLNRRNLFYKTREWPYKYVKPRILAERYLVDESGDELKDYKFYCFDGVPKYMYIAHGRHTDVHYLDFFDMDFNHLDIDRRGYVQSDIKFAVPKHWTEMKKIAATLSNGHPHVRIDFFSVGDTLYLGEFTLFQGGGMMPFYPEKWDYEFGNHLTLPQKNNQ